MESHHPACLAGIQQISFHKYFFNLEIFLINFSRRKKLISISHFYFKVKRDTILVFLSWDKTKSKEEKYTIAHRSSLFKSFLFLKNFLKIHFLTLKLCHLHFSPCRHLGENSPKILFFIWPAPLIDHNWPFYFGNGCIFHALPIAHSEWSTVKQAF